MIFEPLPIEGAYIVRIQKREDKRGFFGRYWCRDEFEQKGLTTDFVQANIALTKHAGTVRGMHYQKPPYGEAKLVRCVRGRIFDVLIDIRPQAASYKQWVGVELVPDDYRMVYLPGGVAHGYQALAPNSEMFYMVSQFYTPEAEEGIRWDDPAFAVEWPITEGARLSPKDLSWPDFI